MLGTAISGLIGQPVYAETVVFNGIGDFMATRTDTLSDGPRVVDIKTSVGNLLLNFAGITVANNGNAPRGAGIAGIVTGAGNVSITGETVTASGTGQTYAVDAETFTGNITINSGTVSATNAAGLSRGIDATTPSGNILISATTTAGSERGIFTGSVSATGSSVGAGTTTIVSGTATANALNQPNAIVAQGRTVSVPSGTAALTNASGNSGAALFAQADAGGATVESTTVMTAGTNQAGIGVNVANGGAASIDSATITAAKSATGINGSSQGGPATIRSGMITLNGPSLVGIDWAADTGAIRIESGTITGASITAGIRLAAMSGAATIVSDTINNAGTGIEVDGDTGTIAITSNILSSTSSGIAAFGGATTISSNAIAGNGSDIQTSAFGGNAVDTSGSIAMSTVATPSFPNGLNGIGIFVTGDTGLTSINSGSILYAGTGNTQGINASGQGAGGLTVTSGIVTTTGDGATGIVGSTTPGR